MDMVLKVLVLIFLLVVGLYVLFKAFRYNLNIGIMCVLIPFYVQYFAWKKSKELYGDKLLIKIWVIASGTGIFWLPQLISGM